MSSTNPTLTIVIPVYNEEKALPFVLPELIAFVNQNGYNLVLTNDGSRDNSLQVLRNALANEPRCKVVNHKVNRGYGGAIKSGILESETDFVITIDADGQHYLEDVTKLFNFLKERDADMVVGSRKGEAEASAIRGVGKSIIRSVAKILMPINIYDINSGMKIYNTAMAKKYIKLCPDSMAYSDVIALVFISQRHLVLEESIRIKVRAAGESTIGARTAFETIMEILNVVILFNPMRVFLPIAMVFILGGAIWEAQFLLTGRGVSIGANLLLVSGIIFFTLGLITEQLSQIRKKLIH
ncbi:MAG TPA: glycosyltransferase family 2 protein [Chitinophagales bacterium]|nr:glycosyltransferase family 2 protein [Chitinophagales bacterium]